MHAQGPDKSTARTTRDVAGVDEVSATVAVALSSPEVGQTSKERTIPTRKAVRPRMRPAGFDEKTHQALVTFEGDDARNLALALKGALEQVGDGDLTAIVGLEEEDINALVGRLEAIQDLIDRAGSTG